jgi:optic atrophy 3 protein
MMMLLLDAVPSQAGSNHFLFVSCLTFHNHGTGSSVSSFCVMMMQLSVIWSVVSSFVSFSFRRLAPVETHQPPCRLLLSSLIQRLAKLGGLLVKTLAKPLSKRIKHEFSRYPFTQNILISVGQGTHQLTSRLTIWSAGYKVRSIKPLEEEQALKQGAEFVGESFILTVSIGVLLYEYNSQSVKAKDKEEKAKAKAKAERDELQAKLHALDVRLKALEDVVKENSNSLLNLTGKKYKEPDKSELVPIDDDPQPTDSIDTTTSEDSEISSASTKGESQSWRQWLPWGRTP